MARLDAGRIVIDLEAGHGCRPVAVIGRSED